MENYRKEMDKKVLEQLKDKIQLYLKRRGLETADFIRKNMDDVAGVYVENSIEKDGPRMQSRGARPNRPSEIMIDKSFAELDKDDNPIGIDKNVSKLIRTQLTHELLHSGARFNGYTGIMQTNENRGLNEGMTQMFTEKIWGYTVSPKADSKYKDYKKIAKILDVTFGESISLDAYFNHSNVLSSACNGLAQNNEFYSDINKYLTSIYYMNKNSRVKKEDRDTYYSSIMKPIKEKMVDLLYEKVCTQIIIPKLKTLSKEEQQTYLYDILDSVKDEPNVLKKLSNAIVKYANMSEKELQEAIKGIDKDLKRAEQEKQFVIDVYNEKDCSELVIISDDGKTIKSFDDPSFIIENESLKEKILSQIYFQEKRVSKEGFGNNVKRICDNLEQDNDLSFGKNDRTALDRKKVFAAMKVTARENGYMILNSLEECESGENISLNAIKAQKGKAVNFQDLKTIYQRFEIDYKDKNWTQLYVKDRETGKEINDPQIEKMAKFAAIWVGSAGTKWMSDEELHGITYAFNEPSEKIYKQFGDLVEKCMTDNGMIDTQAVYEQLSKDKYKHSEEIIRNLLSNRANMSIVYDFYKMQNRQARMETTLSKTSNEFIYGLTGESVVKSEVESIMQLIPDFDSKDTRGQALQQEMEIAKPKQEELQREQDEDEQEPDGKIKVSSVVDTISKGKVTMSETQSAMEDMKGLNKVKRLMFDKTMGKQLTEEQEMLIQNHTRQANEAQVRFQNQQYHRKVNGLEMQVH